MKKVVGMLLASLLMSPVVAAAQGDQPTASGSGQSNPTAATRATAARVDDAQSTRFVRTLTNVQIEFTLTDQTGTSAPEKKTVSMIVSSGNWGKVRSAGNVMAIGEPPYVVDLNVDARPFVSTDGLVQLEMTLVYEPPKGTTDGTRPGKQRITQSQTVVLTSGKPLVISQAADPTSDRKVVVEVKATVLK